MSCSGLHSSACLGPPVFCWGSQTFLGLFCREETLALARLEVETQLFCKQLPNLPWKEFMHQSLNLWKISQCKQLTLSLLWARTLGPSHCLSSLRSAELFLASSFLFTQGHPYLPSFPLLEYPDASPLGLGLFILCCSAESDHTVLRAHHTSFVPFPLPTLLITGRESQESVWRV